MSWVREVVAENIFGVYLLFWIQLGFYFSHILIWKKKKKKETQTNKHLASVTTEEKEVIHFLSPALEKPRKKMALDSNHKVLQVNLLAQITERKRKEKHL